MVVIAIPVLVLLMLAIRGHYRSVEAGLALARIPAGKRAAAAPDRDRADRAARRAGAPGDRLRQLDLGRGDRGPRHERCRCRRRASSASGPEWAGGAELVVIESPYRALIGPLLAYLDVLQRHDPSRPVLVVLSEFVPRHWWENLLHNQTALRLKLRLFTRPNTIVADVPYHLAPAAGLLARQSRSIRRSVGDPSGSVSTSAHPGRSGPMRLAAVRI